MIQVPSLRKSTSRRSAEAEGALLALTRNGPVGRQSYEELLSKFSASTSLHLDFANFCDAVLNDPDKAAKYRQGAEILETGSSSSMLPQ